MYINDFTDNLKCNVNLIADDTSLFTTVYDANQAASDMNHDFNMINNWAHRWRMSFNPDPTKQANEFSRKKILVDHPIVPFKGIPIKNVEEHKHLGIILDSKLSFVSHILSVILKCRRGIGMIISLSKHLPRKM